MEVTRQQFSESLAGVGKKLGIEGLTLSDDDEAFLKIDEVEMILGWSEHDMNVQFYAILGDMPDPPSRTFLKLLLQANNFQSLTKGCAIGFDAEEQVVTLNLRQPAALFDVAQLTETIEDFSATAEVWREHLAALHELENESPEPEPDGNENAEVSIESWVKI